MKKINFKSFLLSVSLFVLFFGVLFFGSKPLEAKLQDFKPLVQIPGLESSMSVGEVTGKNMDMVKSTLLRDYILGIYDYSFAIAGILAAIVLMGGGVLWLISGGSPDKIAKAKKIIGSSLIGLVLLFGSRLILNTINPELIKMKALVFPGIEDKHPDLAIGCCQCSLTDKTWRLFDIKLDSSTICDSSAGLTQKKCDEFCLDQAWKSVEARKKISFKNFTNLYGTSDAVNTFKYDHVCGSGEYENFCVPIEDSEIHPN